MENPGTDQLEAEPSQLELAESELEAALIFARFSSSSYSTGNLQRATDARSKAKAVCARAARRLQTPEMIQTGPDSVKLIWNAVQHALADLTDRQTIKGRVRTASS